MANELIWKNMSTFWNLMAPEYKAYIEQTWDGIKEGVDDAYFQMYEADNAKSIRSCPIHTTRRWMLLDLSQQNLDSVNSAGISLVNSNKTAVDSKVNLDTTIYNTKRSPIHKHYFFKYDADNGLNLPIPFPLDFTTVEIYKEGKLMHALSNYYIIDNAIKFSMTGIYLIYITIDHSPGATYYKQYYSRQEANPDGTIELSPVTDVQPLIVHYDSGQYSGELINPSQYTTISSSRIKTSITSGYFDVIWFTPEEENDFTERHEHKRHEIVYNNDGQSSGYVQSVLFGGPVSQVCNKTSCESILSVYVNGKLLEPFSSDESYKINGNAISFGYWSGSTFVSVPIQYIKPDKLSISIEWINIAPAAEFKYHVHLAYQATNFEAVIAASTFDDGGEFDDGGRFDSEEEIPELQLPFIVRDKTNISIWVNGIYLYQGVDFTFSEGKIIFKIPVFASNIKVEYFENSRVYAYGYTNPQYENSYFSQVNLGLFHDETAEYSSMQLDADGQQLSYATTTAIITSNISVYSIPVITDAVDRMNVAYYEGDTYDVDNGVIYSDIALPEESWCPIVYLDEKTLANNFGYLVDYENNSSQRYKAELANFFRTLWNGPTIQNIEWAVSIFLGMPYSTKKSVIEKIQPILISKTLKTMSESFEVVDTQLTVDDDVVSGQDVQSRIHTSGLCDNNIYLYNGYTVVGSGIGSNSKQGDVFLVKNTQVFEIGDVQTNTITLTTEAVMPFGLLLSTSSMSITQDPAPPSDTVSGLIGLADSQTANIPIGAILKVNSVEHTIIYNSGVGLYFDSSITYNPGDTIEVYTNQAFYIFNKFGEEAFLNDGQVVSIEENNGTAIYTDNGETFIIPFGVETYLRTGDAVEPYQPMAIACSCIDYSIDKEWWFEKNPTFLSSNQTRQYRLAKELNPYDISIYLNTTVDLPDTGVVSIVGAAKGLDGIEYNITERIKYSGKTSNKLLNCIRSYRFENELQFAGKYPINTIVNIDLGYREKALTYLAYQIFKDNTGRTNFENATKYFPLMAKNVTILKIPNINTVDSSTTSIISKFMNRVMPSSSKWFINIDTSYIEQVVISDSEQTSINDIYTINGDVIQDGRAVTELVLDSMPFIVNDQIENGDITADIVSISGNSAYVVYSSALTFSTGQTVSFSGSIATITSNNYLNTLIFNNYEALVSSPSRLVVFDGENTGAYTISSFSMANQKAIIDTLFKNHTSPYAFEKVCFLNTTSIALI